tara:strand:+ start:116 stop:949 length:834 start_codon:yes stop_codon:yes gene_type:complete
MSNNYICKNCGFKIQLKYCSKCGQKNSELLKLKDFFKEIFKDFTELDFRILVTLKKLFTNPGFLTREYWAGKKIKYTHPFKLFVFSGIIYFLLMPTQWSAYDSEMGREVLLNENEKEVMTVAIRGYEVKIENPLLISSFKNYQIIGSKYEREIDVVLAPTVTALCIMLVHLNYKNLYFSHHLITSLHTSAFYYLLSSILIIISMALPSLTLVTVESLEILLFLPYLFLSLKNIYNNSIIITILKVFFLVFLFGTLFGELIIPFTLTFIIMLIQMIIL